MKKATLTIIACACLISSCNCIPKSIRNAFTFCHVDTYTGIDTLINIEGYYSAMIFYDNGLVVRPIYRLAEQLQRKEFLYIEKIVENPETKDSNHFYNFIDCGSYVICGDTIKVQMIHNYHSINDEWNGWEEWYKVLDKNTLHFLNKSLITTNLKEQERFRKYYNFLPGGDAKVTFVPMTVKPPLDYYWILKEKWFWCNESDWKAYLERIKQNKKK